MKYAKYLLAGVPALVVASLALTPLVRAESGSGSGGTSGSTSTTTTKTEAEHTTTTSTTTQPTTTDTRHSGTEVEATHTESTTEDRRVRTEEVEKKRNELQEKLKEVKQENKTRLDDARKKVCEERQDKINSIIQKRSEQATKQLAVFNKISDRVQEFVKTKNLTVENYDTLVTAVKDKEAAAQAAIEANTATTFDCNAAGADKPTALPRTSIDAVRSALHEYRTAIKNLIVQVKASAEKAESTTSTSSTSGEVSQ